jgi:hypothetical protein
MIVGKFPLARGHTVKKAQDVFACLVLVGGSIFSCGKALGATAPSSTTIPVTFTQTLDAAKAKVGEEVSVKTAQVVQLEDGKVLPKGTVLLGHVTEARPFSFDPTPYAAQQPSRLGIEIDKIVTADGAVPIRVLVRALTSTLESDEAKSPHYTDDTDHVGVMVLVGGDASYYPFGKEVLNRDGDIVGYHKKDGVFAHLISSEYQTRYSSFSCEGSNTEQAVWIYSPSACGLYGFDDMYLAENGLGNEQGTFRLESRHRTVKLYARSTALMQVISQSEPGASK